MLKDKPLFPPLACTHAFALCTALCAPAHLQICWDTLGQQHARVHVQAPSRADANNAGKPVMQRLSWKRQEEGGLWEFLLLESLASCGYDVNRAMHHHVHTMKRPVGQTVTGWKLGSLEASRSVVWVRIPSENAWNAWSLFSPPSQPFQAVPKGGCWRDCHSFCVTAPLCSHRAACRAKGFTSIVCETALSSPCVH